MSIRVSRQPPIALLNCTVCDDILRVLEDVPRVCGCGKSAARFTGKGFSFSGPQRILTIDFEQYDGAAPGENRIWKVQDG